MLFTLFAWLVNEPESSMKPFRSVDSPYRVGDIGGFAAYGAAVSQ